MPDKYADYVDHPRFGRAPQFTGLDPDPNDPAVSMHWNATNQREIGQRYRALTGQEWGHSYLEQFNREIVRIPGTAILADLSRQTRATVSVTHYFDHDLQCRDCGRRFIFFAQEQKYWYEDLGFGLNSDCVRCIPCRKREQDSARKREQYETLFHVDDRTPDQNFEMAECCLALIEASVFSRRQTQRVRMLLNQIRMASDRRHSARYQDLLNRVRRVEESGEPAGPPEQG